MEQPPRVTSSVAFVSQIERSVNFYSQLFSCQVVLRDSEAALLVAPGGFQLYLVAKGPLAHRPSSGIGLQYLVWSADSAEALKGLEQALRASGHYTYTHTSGDVQFVEGRDPDGLRVIITHPGPEQRPRSLIDPRLYA